MAQGRDESRPGQPQSSLTLANVQKSEEADYSVLVTNAFGSVTSSIARLTVNLLPVPVICILPATGSCGWSGHWPDRCPTNLLVIACDGASATVVCDGSRSYDPEGAGLRYAWFNGADWFSTNRIAATVLPPGTHVITLLLDDTVPGGTNSASATVEVLSPAQAVGRLVGLVENSGLPLNRQRPLLATLRAALAAVGRADFRPSLNQLEAFEHKVRAQIARSDPALAETLIQATDRIILALGCCDQERHGGQMRSVAHQLGGKVRLEITGPAGQVHLIQASTDLVHWETVGVAVDHGDGSCEFEDAEAGKFPRRFYRLVTP